MKSPVRWLEGGAEAPSGASDLLAAAAQVPAFTDALRYRLAVGIAKTAALPTGTVWTSLLLKGALVASLGGASGFAVHSLAESHHASLPAPVHAAPQAPAASPPSELDSSPPVSVDQLPELQLPTAAPDRAPRLQLDPRLEEAELLEKARGLVLSNPAGALKLTSEHARDFPKGRLGAEAELIAAQALLAMGRGAQAKQRAQASLTRYPNGLYARQLREIVDAQ